MVAARKRENQNRINYKIHLFFYGKENITVYKVREKNITENDDNLMDKPSQRKIPYLLANFG